MTSGRTYEVFVDGKPVRLVGSTIRTLKVRRSSNYTKRFGSNVELRLIREVPRPEDYSDSDYNFYLKACEALDIARKKTYTEDGGLNRISPLIQALGHPTLEREMGRIGNRKGKARGGKIGGRIGGRIVSLMSGHMQKANRLQPQEAKSRGGITQGYKNKSNKLGFFAPGMTSKGGRIGGPIGARVGNCKRWNIDRGKACICGKHLTEGGTARN